jgi:hypothetical protein
MRETPPATRPWTDGRADRSGAGGNNKGAEEESMVYLDGWRSREEEEEEWNGGSNQIRLMMTSRFWLAAARV